MAEEVERTTDGVPPPGEAIHLPGASFLPVLVAAGTSVVVVGVVISWILVAIGLTIVVIALSRWIRETRDEMGELPLEHEHGH